MILYSQQEVNQTTKLLASASHNQTRKGSGKRPADIVTYEEESCYFGVSLHSSSQGILLGRCLGAIQIKCVFPHQTK